MMCPPLRNTRRASASQASASCAPPLRIPDRQITYAPTGDDQVGAFSRQRQAAMVGCRSQPIRLARRAQFVTRDPEHVRGEVEGQHTAARAKQAGMPGVPSPRRGQAHPARTAAVFPAWPLRYCPGSPRAKPAPHIRPRASNRLPFHLAIYDLHLPGIVRGISECRLRTDNSNYLGTICLR